MSPLTPLRLPSATVTAALETCAASRTVPSATLGSSAGPSAMDSTLFDAPSTLCLYNVALSPVSTTTSIGAACAICTMGWECMPRAHAALKAAPRCEGQPWSGGDAQ
eukprot:6214499-Pleurochrysis_carterae.AAC.3